MVPPTSNSTVAMLIFLRELPEEEEEGEAEEEKIVIKGLSIQPSRDIGNMGQTTSES